MGKNEFSYLAIDRAHERQGEADDAFDIAVAAEARQQAVAIRQRVGAGHAPTLLEMAEDWAHRVSQPGVTEQMLRAAVSLGPGAAGGMLADLLQQCIDDAAEVAALKKYEQH